MKRLWKRIKRLLGIKTPLPGGVKRIWASLPEEVVVEAMTTWKIDPPICNRFKED